MVPTNSPTTRVAPSNSHVNGVVPSNSLVNGVVPTNSPPDGMAPTNLPPGVVPAVSPATVHETSVLHDLAAALESGDDSLAKRGTAPGINDIHWDPSFVPPDAPRPLNFADVVPPQWQNVLGEPLHIPGATEQIVYTKGDRFWSHCRSTPQQLANPVCSRIDAVAMERDLTFYFDRGVLDVVVEGADIGARAASVGLPQLGIRNHRSATENAAAITKTLEEDLRGFDDDGVPFTRPYSIKTEGVGKQHPVGATDKKNLQKLHAMLSREEADALAAAAEPDEDLDSAASSEKRRIDDMSHDEPSSVNSAIPLCTMMVLVMATVMDMARLIHRVMKASVHTTKMFMGKVDLKHGYKHVRVMPGQEKYMLFLWMGVLYCHLCLPFGLRPACHIFARLTNAVTWVMNKLSRIPILSRADFDRALHALTVSGAINNRTPQRYFVHSFVDDFGILARTLALFSEGRQVLLWLLERWGLMANLKKLAIEGVGSTKCVWLGLLFNLTSPGYLRFDPLRRKMLCRYLNSVVGATNTGDRQAIRQLLGTRRKWNRLLGYLIHASITMTMARLHLNGLLADMRAGARVPSAACVADLLFFRDALAAGSGIALARLCQPIWLQRDPFPFFCDAARDPSDPSSGFGAFLVTKEHIFFIAGTWEGFEKHLHINVLETAVMAMAIEIFGSLPVMRAIALHPIAPSVEPSRAMVPPAFLVQSDNTTAIAALGPGRTRSERCARIAREAHMHYCRRGIAAWTSHVPGIKNIGADHLSRGRIRAFLSWASAHLPSFPAPVQLLVPIWTRRRYLPRE